MSVKKCFRRSPLLLGRKITSLKVLLKTSCMNGFVLFREAKARWCCISGGFSNVGHFTSFTLRNGCEKADASATHFYLTFVSLHRPWHFLRLNDQRIFEQGSEFRNDFWGEIMFFMKRKVTSRAVQKRRRHDSLSRFVIQERRKRVVSMFMVFQTVLLNFAEL